MMVSANDENGLLKMFQHKQKTVVNRWSASERGELKMKRKTNRAFFQTRVLLQNKNQLFVFIIQNRKMFMLWMHSVNESTSCLHFCLISLYHIFHFEKQVQRGSYL